MSDLATAIKHYQEEAAAHLAQSVLGNGLAEIESRLTALETSEAGEVERGKVEQDFWHDTLPEILGDLSAGRSNMYMAHCLIHAALEPLLATPEVGEVDLDGELLDAVYRLFRVVDFGARPYPPHEAIDKDVIPKITALTAELKEARGLLEEVSLPPYPDSDPGSLLDTLRARAAAYLTRTKPSEVEAEATIERVNPDDEIVGRGWVHIERMSGSHIWMNILGLAFDMHAEKGRLVWSPQGDSWKEISTKPEEVDRTMSDTSDWKEHRGAAVRVGLTADPMEANPNPAPKEAGGLVEVARRAYRLGEWDDDEKGFPIMWGEPNTQEEYMVAWVHGHAGSLGARHHALALIETHTTAELEEARGLLEEMRDCFGWTVGQRVKGSIVGRALAYLTRTKPEVVEPTESVEKVCTCDELEWDKNCTVHTDAYFKPAPKEAVIKVDVFSCPEHGPTMADEDGCCSTCGADTKIGSANLTAPT